MARKAPAAPVKMAFEDTGLRITIADIQPLKLVTTEFKKTPKYRQIEASILEVLSSRLWSRGTGLDQESISCLMAICASKF
jgi:hypothetical protein